MKLEFCMEVESPHLDFDMSSYHFRLDFLLCLAESKDSLLWLADRHGVIILCHSSTLPFHVDNDKEAKNKSN